MAMARISAQQGPFFPAPRPYPELAAAELTWLKQGSYWIAFTAIPDGYAIMSIFYDRANIPGRIVT